MPTHSHLHQSVAASTAPPRLIFWELTQACNLSCVHCRASAQLEPSPEELTTDEAIQFIDGLASYAKPILVLTGGEPLLRKDLFVLARRAVSQDIPVALATNGTLIGDDVASAIAAAGIRHVAISVDGAKSTTHNRFRGQPGAFEAALKGIAALRRRRIEVQLNVTVSRHNHEELPDLVELGLDLGASALHLFMLVPVGCGLLLPQDTQLNPEEQEDVLAWFYRVSRQVPIHMKATCAPHYYRIMRQEAKRRGEKLVTQTHGHEAVTKGCLAGTGVAFVSRVGDVQPCGYFPVQAGNIRQQTFKHIWETAPLFKTLREPALLEGKCGACEFKRICSGCRARAYSTYGSYLAEDPACSYQPLTLQSS